MRGAVLVGMPELQRKLQALELKAAGDACKDAVMAMGRVIADEWAARVPVDHGDYRAEMQQPGVVKAGVNTRKGVDPEGLRILKGATGSVAPRMRPGIAGLDETQQPAVYAAQLEFGGRSRPAEPSARPAFDAARERAIEAAEPPLRKAVEAL